MGLFFKNKGYRTFLRKTVSVEVSLFLPKDKGYSLTFCRKIVILNGPKIFQKSKVIVLLFAKKSVFLKLVYFAKQ